MKRVSAMFVCRSVTKIVGWEENYFLYNYDFNAVTGGTEEKNSFFAATPAGSITLQGVRGDLFEPGREYRVQFEMVEQGN